MSIANLPGRVYRKVRSLYFRYFHHDYSQAGETVAIRQLLKKKRGEVGYFVELGANDGVMGSNSYGLLQEGWSGIAVEPNPAVFAKLEANWQRFPQAKRLPMAVAPTRGTVRLYLGNNDPSGMLSTISTDSSEWYDKTRSEKFVEVPAMPLTDLLNEQGVSPSFDLLLVDTEGMDYDILLTLDFQRYRPKLIVTEDYEPKNAVKFQLLESAGYTLAKHIGANTFWLDARQV